LPSTPQTPLPNIRQQGQNYLRHLKMRLSTPTITLLQVF